MTMTVTVTVTGSALDKLSVTVAMTVTGSARRVAHGGRTCGIWKDVTTLLCAILGDMRKESGHVELHGNVVYVARMCTYVYVCM